MALPVFKTGLSMQVDRWVRLPPSPAIFILLRVFHKSLNVAGDRPPRYGEKNAALHVGRGPSHATRACERVPLAMRLAARPPHPCRAGSSEALACWFPSDPDLQRWARGRGSRPPPKGDRFMKHPHFTREIQFFPVGEPSRSRCNTVGEPSRSRCLAKANEHIQTEKCSNRFRYLIQQHSNADTPHGLKRAFRGAATTPN